MVVVVAQPEVIVRLELIECDLAVPADDLLQEGKRKISEIKCLPNILRDKVAVEICEQSAERGISGEVVEGISYLCFVNELDARRLIDVFEQVVDGRALQSRHTVLLAQDVELDEVATLEFAVIVIASPSLEDLVRRVIVLREAFVVEPMREELESCRIAFR